MGAQTSLLLCYEDLEKLENGEYYKNCKKSKRSSASKDISMQQEYIKYSWMLIEKAIKGRF